MAEDYDLPNPFVDLAYPNFTVPLTQTQRLAKLTAKGASLGFANQNIQAEGLLEHGVEFAGGIPTIVGLSAAGVPAAPLAAARLAKLGRVGKAVSAAIPTSPTGIRLGTAGGIGGLTGTAKAIQTGDITEIPTDIALNVGMEAAGLGVGRAIKALRGTPEAQQNLQSALKNTTTVVPETPPPSVPKDQLTLPEVSPQLELMPPTAHFGPRIDSDSLYRQQISEQSKTPFAPTAPGRVGLDHFTKLPPGVVDASELMDVPPGTLYQATTTNFGEGPARSALVTPEDLSKMFEIRPSPEGGAPILVPLTQQADDAVKALRAMPNPRQTEMQFGPDQLEFFGREEGRAIRDRFNGNAVKREQMKTSELVKKPADEVERIINDPANDTKIVETVTMRKTKDGKQVDEFLAKNNLTTADAAAIYREAEAHALSLGLTDKASRNKAIAAHALKLLQERCT